MFTMGLGSAVFQQHSINLSLVKVRRRKPHMNNFMKHATDKHIDRPGREGGAAARWFFFPSPTPLLTAARGTLRPICVTRFRSSGAQPLDILAQALHPVRPALDFCRLGW